MILCVIILLPPAFPGCENPGTAIRNGGRDDRDCVDPLKRFPDRPEHLVFMEHRPRQGQTVCSTLYRVPGEYAAAVEKYLMRRFGMARLVFRCCGWEPKDGRSGAYRKPEYSEKGLHRHYRITMYSDETVIRDRGRWGGIRYFHVLAEIIEL